jgi:hypothetical protein
MKVILIAILLLAACAVQTATSDQALCTIEDQQAGTCPPTSGIVEDALSYTEGQHGPDAVHSHSRCWRDESGWRCTVKMDFWWGYVLTTCSDLWCYSTTHPGSHVAEPSLCPIEDQEAGICDGPAGGWTSLRQHLQSYVESTYPDATPATTSDCGGHLGGSGRWCTVSLDFGSYVIHVTCEDLGPGTSVTCHSWVGGAL